MTSTRSGVLGNLQSLLETVYDVRVDQNVDEYLITDAALAQELDCDGRVGREKLLLRSDGGRVDVTLYLDKKLLRRLARADPFATLCDGNIAEFCTVVEGVSHFVYVAWNAAKDKQVTLLELELQAEVDKFVVCAVLLRRQLGALPRALRKALFQRFVFAADIGATELDRYRVANQFAARYCSYLETMTARGARLLPELRRFYRLPKLGKLAHSGAVA